MGNRISANGHRCTRDDPVGMALILAQAAKSLLVLVLD
jgi:hypothetical protein